ncbi:MAG: 30S ribosomal protein S4e [Thermoplasmata archaeon]
MKKHLKRLASPRSWMIPRKKHKWVTRPRPGPHGMEESIPLQLILRDMLHYCDSSREARILLSSRGVLVDGKPVRDLKRGVGLMDVLSFEQKKEHFRMLIDTKGRLQLVGIDAKQAKWKLSRIEGKTTVRGGRIQLNLYDGRNILLDKNAYRPGDVLKISVPDQKIKDHYELTKGNIALLVGGKHVGEFAKLEEYGKTRNPRENEVMFEEGFSTSLRNVFVVGKKAPEIKIPETKVV